MSVFQMGPEFAEEITICRLNADIVNIDHLKPAIITRDALARELEKGVSTQLSELINGTSKEAMDEFKKKGATFRVTKPIGEAEAHHLALWMQATFPEGLHQLDEVKAIKHEELASLLFPQAFFSSPNTTFCQAGGLQCCIICNAPMLFRVSLDSTQL